MWVSKETRELHPFQEKNIRNWGNRADMVHKDGVSVIDSQMEASYPPEVIETLGYLYLVSMKSPADILKFFCEQE